MDIEHKLNASSRLKKRLLNTTPMSCCKLEFTGVILTTSNPILMISLGYELAAHLYLAEDPNPYIRKAKC